MDFNGTDQYINLGSGPVPNTVDFSMTAWVNLNDLSGTGTVVSNIGVWESENTSPVHSTTPGGSNRLLVFFVCNETSTDTAAVTSVTYGGQSMTFVSFVEVDDTDNARIEMWILNEASITSSIGQSFIVVFPGSNDVAYHHVFIENVDQTTPTGTISTNTAIAGGDTIATSASIASTTGDMIIGCVCAGESVTFTSNNSFTEGTDQTHTGGGGTSTSSTQFQESAGVVLTPSFTASSAPNRQCIFGIEINLVTLSIFTSHAIIRLADDTTPYSGARIYIKRGTDPGRIGAFDPDTATLNFSADIAVTANQWDLAAVRGNKNATLETVGILGGGTWETGTTHTTEVGSNRLLVVIAAHNDADELVDMSTITYGTQSLTFVILEEVTTGFVNHIELWYLNEVGIAAASSSTFVFTWAGGADRPRFTHAFFENVDQTIPIADSDSGTTTVSDTITTPAITSTSSNDMVVAGASVGETTTFTPNNSFIEGSDFNEGASHTATAIYIQSTGSDIPSTTTADPSPNRIAMVSAALGASSIGTIDVSLNGETWTNLITGSTTGWTVNNSVSVHSIGVTEADAIFTNFVDGSVADVRCYGRQLDQAEIQTIYTSKGKDGIVDDLLARWPFNHDDIGSTAAAATVTFVAATTTSNAADSSEASVSPTVPTSVEGDLIIASIGAGSELDNTVGVLVTADDSDWILLNAGDHPVFATSFTTPTLWIYIRTATSSEPGTYTFTAAAGNPMIGQMATYRNVPGNFGRASPMTQANSGTATSPAVTFTNTALVVRIACVDGQSLPGTPTDFYPSSTNQRVLAENGATNPNGCTLGLADEIGVASIVARTWTHTSEENGGVTVTFVVNDIFDVSGAANHPHRGQAVESPIFIEHELRL